MKRGQKPAVIMNKTQLQLFTKHIQLDILTGCWIWKGCLTKLGYGRVKLLGYSYSAHRVSYWYFNGITHEGLEIDHLCRNRNCVNPLHLEETSHKENLRQGARKTNQSLRWFCNREHVYDKENAYIRSDGYRMCKKCQRLVQKR